MNPEETDRPESTERNIVRREIHDPDKVAQANRIRSLLERRKKCVDALEEVTISAAQSKNDQSDARLIFIAHLRSLILDLYPLLLNETASSSDSESEESESETDQTLSELLQSYELGTFKILPPEEIPSNGSIGDELVPGETDPDSREIKVEGLEWFLNHDCPIRHEWSVEVAGKEAPVTASKTVVPPLRICIEACKVSIECMQKLGIEADIEADNGDLGFDYSEIDQSHRNNDEQH